MKRVIVFVLVLGLWWCSRPFSAHAAVPYPLFLPYQNYGGGAANTVAAGDFNSDGLRDVAIVGYGSLRVFLQDPATHQLGQPIVYPLSTYSWDDRIAVGDFNDDGRADLVTVHSDRVLRLWLQLPDSSLDCDQMLGMDDRPDGLAVADLNGDGRQDVVVSHENAPWIGVFLQEEAGGLETILHYPSTQSGWNDIEVGDVNGDGRMDVVKMNGQGSSPSFLVYTQTLTGTLNSPVAYNLDAGSAGNAIGVGDVTGDERDDVVVSYGWNSPGTGIAIFPQTELGVLGLPETYLAYHFPEPVKVTDVTSDGLKDIVLLHDAGMAAGVYRQRMDGSLKPYELYGIPPSNRYWSGTLDVADVNDDGFPDLLVADYSYGLSVLYHTSPADLSLSMQRWPGSVLEGETVTYTLSILNSGPLTATQVFLTDSLPAGSTWLTTITTAGTCSGSNSVTCQLGTVGVGRGATVLIAAGAPASLGLKANTAGILAVEDFAISNNYAQAIVRVDSSLPPQYLPLIRKGPTPSANLWRAP